MRGVGHRHLLPPPPRPIAWLSGGIVAGLLLGLAQILCVAKSGVVLPPAFALLLLGATAASVVLFAAPAGLALQLLGRRPSHSGFVGAMVGPLLVAAATAPLWKRCSEGGQALWLAGVLGAGLVAGIFAARLASWAERTGRPASAGLVWAGASVLLTAIVWWPDEGEASRKAWGAFAAIVAGAAIVGAGFLRRARPGTRSPGTRFGRMLLLAVPGAAACALSPWFAPWILLDSSLPPTGLWPPNFLVVLLQVSRETDDQRSEGVATHPARELLSSGALTYELDPDSGVGSLVMLPDATLLAPRLHAAGYVTAAILSAAGSLEVGADHVDDRPGGRRVLEEVSWLAGAPLLLGPGSELLPLVGQDRNLRRPEELGATAARWLVHWRATRAPAPFFLVVDFRDEGSHADSVDAGFVAVLGRLEELGMGDSSLIVVGLEDARPERGRTRVFVDLPLAWPRPSERVGSVEISGSELSLALLRLGQGPPGKSWALPGLAGPLFVPERTE